MDLDGIKDIFNPNYFQGVPDINGIENNVLLDMLGKMILIRMAEEKISENIENGIIKCPCHLAIGQEAIAVALSYFMNSTDRAFGAHRSHAHFLALNEDTYSLFSEVLGKNDGCSRGMGGSMHLTDINNGFYGSVPIVGATIPIATGAGLAAKMDGNKDIAISYFGDGACEEGVLHESLNMASTMQLPVLYVCENNLFSSHLHIDLRQSSRFTSRFAKSHGIKSISTDGNNIADLYKVFKREINILREQGSPFYLEAITYRWKGHVGHRDDIDVGVKRSEDLEVWKFRDPIKRLSNALLENEVIDAIYLNEISLKIQQKINNDWSRALSASYPTNDKLLSEVYSK